MHPTGTAMRLSLRQLGVTQLQMIAPVPLFFPEISSKTRKQSASVAFGEDVFFTSTG